MMGDDALVRRAVWAATGREAKPKWAHVARIFALGSGSARELCRRFDCDPDQTVGGAAGWVPPLRAGVSVAIALDDLDVLGFMGSAPMPRETPWVVSPVLAARETDEVFVPPFKFVKGQGEWVLLRAKSKMSRFEFRELCDVGEATKFWGLRDRETTRPIPDGCFFFAVGNGQGVYITHAEAAERIAKFAAEKIAEGQALCEAGKDAEGLEMYGLAAAASQKPVHYELMLSCPAISAERRKRIEALLEARKDVAQ